MSDRRFGFQQIPDSRDMLYSMPLKVQRQLLPEIVRYKVGKILDQGSEGSCCGQACKQLLQSQPFEQEDGPEAEWIYHEAQKIDEFPEGTEGTSVRAALEILRRLGLIESFHWAPNLDSVLDWLAVQGPVDAGTYWFSYDTESDGRVPFTGRAVGGHSYLLTGYDLHARVLFMANSWGRSYGKNGEGYITFDDFARQLSRGGVAAGVIERKREL